MATNIIFPEIAFTTPGVYVYTIKELTTSDENWETDPRVYRAVVTVTDNGTGELEANVDYPDGFPVFINMYRQPEPPSKVCKCFYKLPFPMFLFAPPQKPEFMELIETHPGFFEWWERVVGGIEGA